MEVVRFLHACRCMIPRIAIVLLTACSATPPSSEARDATAPEAAPTFDASQELDASQDSSPADAEAPDAPASTSGCDAPGLLLCDDFEASGIDTSTWTSFTNNGGQLDLSTTHAHSGAQSLHAHVPPNAGADAHVTETRTFPQTGANLFGRAWIYFEPSAPIAHVAYFWASGPKATYTFASQDGTLMSLAYFSSNETASHSTTGVPIGHWACMEWNFNPAAGTADYWLDGTPLADLHEGSWGKDSFQSHDFGISLFGTDKGPAAYDVWFDDIAVATSRIGCS